MIITEDILNYTAITRFQIRYDSNSAMKTP